MARAFEKTLLALDRWAYHMGLDPRHFNQLYDPSGTYFPVGMCHQAWLQYPWQSADRVGREEVAQAIALAEIDVAELLGFYPMPTWTADEVVLTAHPKDRTLVGGSGLQNSRGLYQSVQAERGMMISGGVEKKDLVRVKTRPAEWDWQDLDIDGYFETAVLVYPGIGFTDVNEVAIYFHDRDGADEWEIRPLKYVDITADILTVHIDRHLLVDPNLWEEIASAAIDGTIDASFVDVFDLYRHWHDPSEQAQLQWERVPGDCSCGSITCPSCAWQIQDACIQTRNQRLGIVTYQPATWDETEELYSPAAIAVSRRPERVRLSYRSGFQSSRVARPMVEMDPFFERMISIYAITLMDRKVCGCDNIGSMFQRWQEDLALVSQQGRYQLTKEQNRCPWGTRAGAVEAFARLNRRRIGGGVSY